MAGMPARWKLTWSLPNEKVEVTMVRLGANSYVFATARSINSRIGGEVVPSIVTP